MNYLKNKKNIFILCKIKRLNIFNNLIKKNSVLNFLFKTNPNFKLLIIRIKNYELSRYRRKWFFRLTCC